MGTRTIRLYGDPVLRRKARLVSKITDEERALIRDMLETMEVAEGAGLAAPQIGASKRIVVFRKENDTVALINPEVSRLSDETEVEPEGCLSLPNLRGDVPRYLRLSVTGLSEQGRRVKFTAEGLLARAVQHEVDHLDGKLYIDRMEEGSLKWILYETNDEGEDVVRLEPTTVEAVREAMGYRRIQRKQ